MLCKSRSVRARGLKQNKGRITPALFDVALRAGAWIETPYPLLSLGMYI